LTGAACFCWASAADENKPALRPKLDRVKAVTMAPDKVFRRSERWVISSP
jgi:hypothetical protein